MNFKYNTTFYINTIDYLFYIYIFVEFFFPFCIKFENNFLFVFYFIFFL